MTFATRLTKVRYRSEHFDERTGMCYHPAPPSERVVVHVRDAEQAKPHLEHNPLSLLGACYATPRRKLNDPETLPAPVALLSFQGRAMSHNINTLAIGTMQHLGNHGTPIQSW